MSWASSRRVYPAMPQHPTSPPTTTRLPDRGHPPSRVLGGATHADTSCDPTSKGTSATTSTNDTRVLRYSGPGEAPPGRLHHKQEQGKRHQDPALEQPL